MSGSRRSPNLFVLDEQIRQISHRVDVIYSQLSPVANEVANAVNVDNRRLNAISQQLRYINQWAVNIQRALEE